MELKQLPWLMSVGTGLQRILPEAYEKWAGQINSWFSETTIKGQPRFRCCKEEVCEREHGRSTWAVSTDPHAVFDGGS